MQVLLQSLCHMRPAVAVRAGRGRSRRIATGLAGFLLAPRPAEQRVCIDPHQVLRFESKSKSDKR